ncbi:hypothetical protein AOG54_02300 [Acidiplasma aeolicum]|uniref:Peptidase n=1 Tax=Acidiplasma aeolicum TaxID=507754 RepID=A0A0Q0XLK1_9ARCH|nr:hypothetical protein AOG54_02300 [Acidiplasma aeolicum]
MNTTGRIRVKKLRSELLAVFFFVLSSLLALYLAINIHQIPGIASEKSAVNIYFVLYYLVFLIVFTAIILMLVKKHADIIRAIFLAAVIYMVFVVSSIIADIISVNFIEYYLIIILITGIFGYLIIFKNEWYITDAAGILMISGSAAILGNILRVYIAIALLIVFAVYDYISVYKTKHMVSLARAAVDNSFPLMFTLPENYNMKLRDLTFDNRGENNVMMLGFGDMAIPEILVISASISNISHIYLYFILTTLGSISAMIILFYINKNKPAPGLPLINSGAIAGYLIALIITII